MSDCKDKVQADNATTPGGANQRQKEPAPSQAVRLVHLVESLGPKLFQDPRGRDFISLAIDGRQETWALESKDFRQFLSRRAYQAQGSIPSRDALTEATDVLSGRILLEGETHEVHVRLAEHGECIYLDLADQQRRVVEVSPSGWKVVSQAPVYFRRQAGMHPLPVPQTSQPGALDQLRQLLNAEDEDVWRSVLSWALGALRPRGPHKVLVVTGEQGSAKTSFCETLLSVLDPREAGARAAPGAERDLLIAAANSWVLGYDNVSEVRPWLSDAAVEELTTQGVDRLKGQPPALRVDPIQRVFFLHRFNCWHHEPP